MSGSEEASSDNSLQDRFDRVYSRAVDRDRMRSDRHSRHVERLSAEADEARAKELEYKNRLLESETRRIAALGKRSKFLKQAEKAEAKRVKDMHDKWAREERERLMQRSAIPHNELSWYQKIIDPNEYLAQNEWVMGETPQLTSIGDLLVYRSPDRSFAEWAANAPGDEGYLGLGYFGLQAKPVRRHGRRRRGTRRRATHN